MAVQLSAEARELLLEVRQDPNGLVLKLSSLGGSAILKSNGRTFGDGSPAEQKRWEGGVRQLMRFGFVEAQGERGLVFWITSEGCDAADDLMEGRRS